MAFAIDTAATIADLEAAGVEPTHAKAIVKAINGAAGDPVSKDDFKELRGEFNELRAEVKAEINGLRVEVKAEINGLRAEVRAEIKELRDEFNGLRDEVKAEINGLRDEFNELRAEVKAEINELREEGRATFATKADLATLKSELTIRILLGQFATAMLLFGMLKVFG